MYRSVFTGYGDYGGLGLYDQASPIIESMLGAPPRADLAVTTALHGDTIAVSSTVARRVSSRTDAVNPLKLMIVLVEDSLFIPGGNSPIQNHVVRAVAGDSATGFGFALSPDRPTEVVQNKFNLRTLEQEFRRRAVEASEGDPSSWNPRVYNLDRTQLSVVAYIQDQVTGEILQAVQRRL